MKLWHRIVQTTQRTDEFPKQLFAFLGSGEREMKLFGGRKISREEARLLLQELLPAEIQVRGVCSQPVSVVAAAPHVHYDHWTEYFCNRIAKQLALGWVVAINYRDGDSRIIPAVIGRHIHVNRPMESAAPRGAEYESERARDVFRAYQNALRAASNRDALPLDGLVEFHAHHRTPHLEIASAGVTMAMAEELFAVYEAERLRNTLLPEMRIEPLHDVCLKAENTKHFGSMQENVTRRALHIEIPREARQSDAHRRLQLHALMKTLTRFLQLIHSET